MGLEPLVSSRVRALGAFFGGGAVLCLVAPLLPASVEASRPAMLGVGGVALAVAAWLWRRRAPLPQWGLHALILFGNVLITVVIVLAGPGEAGASWAIMFVWAPVFTAAYARRHEFVAHLCSTVLLHALALALLGTVEAPGTRLLLTGATALMAASVVGALVSRIRQLAGTDELTGLANRRTFDANLARHVAIGRRRGRPVAVAVIDLDGFKQLNDRHGHARGDEVLREVADAWAARLRTGDLLARVGGDEFALLLPDCSLEDARRIGEDLIAVTPVDVGATIGVSVVGPTQSPEAAVAAADDALYARKRDGGGAVGVPCAPVG